MVSSHLNMSTLPPVVGIVIGANQRSSARGDRSHSIWPIKFAEFESLEVRVQKRVFERFSTF